MCVCVWGGGGGGLRGVGWGRRASPQNTFLHCPPDALPSILKQTRKRQLFGLHFLPIRCLCRPVMTSLHCSKRPSACRISSQKARRTRLVVGLFGARCDVMEFESKRGRVLSAVDRAQELCESRGGRPGLLSLISLRFMWT